MSVGTEEFDYVVVGAGAAGSVVAARLSEDAGITVCVLESGPPDLHPYIHVPAGYIKIMSDPRFTWQFQTEPVPSAAGRKVWMPVGRTVGGSSSINGLVINRGQPADFDQWAQLGNPGWGYADVLPYFKKFERRIGEADPAYRGLDGPIPVTDQDWIHPISRAFVEGAAGLGIPRNPDYNAESQPGVGYFQRAIHKGLRRSAARQYLLPALRKTRRIDLRTRVRASRVLFEGRRATGVEYIDERDRSRVRRVTARREVVICCGALNTPRLLQVSGVGAPDLLAGLGVPVVHALPGVGENFRDHASVRVVARARPGIRTLNEEARGLPLVGQIARWMLRRPSILATSPSHVHCFWKSDPSLSGADLQVVFTPASYKGGFGGLLDTFPGMSCGVWQHRPESRGYVRARSADVFVDPLIQPNYLADPVDQRAMIGGVRLARRLLGTPQLEPFFESETLPGRGIESDQEILDWLRANCVTVWHVIGAAKMGPSEDPLAVVDSQLRVHGLEALRVVDASIMPTVPSANTYASTLMIAEKGSDMVRGRGC